MVNCSFLILGTGARHHKRRLITPAFAGQVRRVLAPGGVVRMATDWQDYAEQMREVFDAAPGFAHVICRSGRHDSGRTHRSSARPRKGRDVQDLAWVDG